MSVSMPPRRRSKTPAILAVLALVAFVFIGLPVIFCAVVGAKAPRIEKGTVITLRIDGAIAEGPSSNPFAQLQDAGGTLSLHELRQLVNAAKNDDKVAGVLLLVGPMQAGFGKLEEVRDLIGQLREAKKPVHALLMSDFVDEPSYYVASAADRIVVNPESGFMLNGLNAEVTFWKGSLEKLHVEPQFIMFKEYKSAGEPMSRKDMSPAFREWLTSVLTEYNTRFLDTVADRRGITDKAALQKLFDKGGLTAKQALEAKLVDALGYYDEVEEAIRGAGAPGVKEPHVMSGKRYLAGRRGAGIRGEKIAVLYAVGPISSSHGSNGIFGGDGISGPDLAKAIRDAADDKSVKAIVMRIDSPGGSAVGSDFIRREVSRAKAKKPFISSMSSVAGSGGYWIAMDSDAIVSQPSTLTGSIGVVFGKFNTRGFYNWIGANVESVKIGENADLMSTVESLDAQQLATINEWMTEVYGDFVKRVAEGRKMTFEEAEPLAHGRVWTGAQAKERKLVDELGGLDRAIALAKDKAGIAGKDHQLVVFPKEKTIFEALAEGMAGASVRGSTSTEAEMARILEAVELELSTPKAWLMTPEIEVH